MSPQPAPADLRETPFPDSHKDTRRIQVKGGQWAWRLGTVILTPRGQREEDRVHASPSYTVNYTPLWAVQTPCLK